MNPGLTRPVLLLIALALSVMVAHVLLQWGSDLLLLLLAGALLTVLALKLQPAQALVLLGLVLALGSAFRWDIVHQTYYLRFFLLGVLALRAFVPRGHHLVNKHQTSSVASRWTSLHSLFLLTGIMACLTAMYSLEPWLSLQRGLSLLLLFVVLFIWLWPHVDSPERITAMMRSLLVVFVVMVGVGYVLLLSGYPGMRVAGRLRLVFMNANTLGHFCALVLPLLVWSVFEVKGRVYGKVLLMTALVMALVLSGSRGAMVAAASGLGLQFILGYRKRFFLALVVVVMLVAAGFLREEPLMVEPGQTSVLQDVIIRDEHLQTGSGRTDIWRAAMRRVGERPWLGYGFGTTHHMFQKGYFPWLADFQGANVHNSYIEVLLNMGWLGAIGVFAALLSLLVTGLRCLLKPMSVTWNYRLSVALFATILVGLVSAVFESWLLSVGSVFCMPFWLVAMMLLRMIDDYNDWGGVTDNSSA